MSLLQRFHVVVTLVLAAVVTSIVIDAPPQLLRVAIPISPATEPRIVRALCREGRVRVTPVPAFAAAVPAKTDVNQACLRDWNDTLHAFRTSADCAGGPDESSLALSATVRCLEFARRADDAVHLTDRRLAPVRRRRQ